MGRKASNKPRNEKKREHNHFPAGKSGYVPQGVGITNLKLLKHEESHENINRIEKVR